MDFIHSKHALLYPLIPVSYLYQGIAKFRKFLYKRQLMPTTSFPVPIIVVGNISVGGTGKTPVIIWLAHILSTEGYKVGIVSRGYGAQTKNFPQIVTRQSNPFLVGDEPVVIARNTECPVVVDPKRVNAVKYLLAHHKVDLILSDDGLQHYALQRDIEIAIVDGMRGFGNGYCLPAGPLREPISRLHGVDFVLCNTIQFPIKNLKQNQSFTFKFEPKLLRNLRSPEKTLALNELKGEKNICAMAGIGNPYRFFETLKQCQINFTPTIFPDHHPYKPSDIHFKSARHIIMTEKDAIKCETFADERHWYLEGTISLGTDFISKLLTCLKQKQFPESKSP